MEFSELLNYILYIVLTTILPVITAYTVNLIKAHIKESNLILDATQTEYAAKLMESALSDVMDAVLYVNQVYTDSLKKSGQFDEKAQNEAFNRAYVEAVALISGESKKAVEQLYGSFDKWLRLKIEASVNISKNNSKEV